MYEDCSVPSDAGWGLTGIRPAVTRSEAIPVGPSEGIDHDSVASFDNIAAVPKSVLALRLGRLDELGRLQMSDALRAMADC